MTNTVTPEINAIVWIAIIAIVLKQYSLYHTKKVEREEIKNWKERAELHLEWLRKLTPKYDGDIRNIRSSLSYANLNLEDIGTSEEEIGELRINSCRFVANSELKKLREGTTGYRDSIESILLQISNGNFLLKDIGTNEEQLEELRIKNCKFAAHEYLERLRKGEDLEKYGLYKYYEILNLFRSEIFDGNFELQNFNTSEEEIISFLK